MTEKHLDSETLTLKDFKKITLQRSLKYSALSLPIFIFLSLSGHLGWVDYDNVAIAPQLALMWGLLLAILSNIITLSVFYAFLELLVFAIVASFSTANGAAFFGTNPVMHYAAGLMGYLLCLQAFYRNIYTFKFYSTTITENTNGK